MKKIFILTGEPSGDKLASTVISKLKINNPDIGVVFDQDLVLARQSRRRILDILATEKIMFSGGHILSPALGYVVHEGVNYSWQQANPASI